MQARRTSQIATVALAIVFVVSAVARWSVWITVLVGLGAIVAALGVSRSEDTRPDIENQIAQVAHELRTPLTSVRAALDLLVDPSAGLELTERTEILELAGSEAGQMLHLVDNLTLAAKMAQETIQPEAIGFSLSTTIRQAIRRNPSVAERTSHTESVPTGVVADPQLVTQIVGNLVQNIARYAPYGRIDVEYELVDGNVVACFADGGPGIEPDAAEKIFEGNKSRMGLGVGLKLSRTLARAMGGDLTLRQHDDPEASGCVFALTLPAVPAGTNPDPLPSDIGPADPVALSPRSRLLIDIASVLSESSLDILVSRLHGWYTDLLGAHGGILMVPKPEGAWDPAGSFGSVNIVGPGITSEGLDLALTTQMPLTERSLPDRSPSWAKRLNSEGAIFFPLKHHGSVLAVLVIGWEYASEMPEGTGVLVAEALATLTGVAFRDTEEVVDGRSDRVLRSSVMESLPLAISVFEGNPPRVVDWNQAERDMLGMKHDTDRPREGLDSMQKYQLRYEDGTLLQTKDSQVMLAITTGRSTGPTTLFLTRPDGAVVKTISTCYPVRNNRGDVTGAVVLSEVAEIVTPTVKGSDAQ
ncbi:MAG: HAMP domain-containing histidine kinase [Actinobacteria bacterium]|nr:HAMP domain-containing histidine kinase [Actinomycetota bacterium]